MIAQSPPPIGVAQPIPPTVVAQTPTPTLVAHIPPPTVVVQAAPAPDSGGDGLIELAIAILTFLGAALWPIAFLIALWWFREPIKAKINEATTLEGFGVKLLLADALGRAKQIEGKVDVNDEPDTVEATGTVDLKPDDLTTTAPTLGRPTLNTEPPSFDRLAAVAPETAILYQWGQIEERLVELAHFHALPINRRRGASQAIEYLDAANIIPPRLTSVIRDLYSVRNLAAHPTGHMTFSRHEVLRFRDASDIVVKELDELITKTTGQPPKP